MAEGAGPDEPAEVPRRPDELAGIARLTGAAVEMIARPGQRTHQAIAGGVFRLLGPVGRPVRLGHDAIAALSWGAVRKGGVLVGDAVAGVATLTGPRPARLDRSTGGSGLVGAVNGLLGDRLVDAGNELGLGLTLRHRDRDLPVRTDALRAAHPAPRGHLVLLVPGLGETEHAWRFAGFRRRRGRRDRDYGTRLAADLDVTPLYLRYNTGRPLAENGAALSALLAELVERWPVPVTRIDLIGHSMGGLVCRWACAHGVAQAPVWGTGTAWTERLRHVVYLGSPHTGAELARGAGALAGLLAGWEGSRAWAEFLNLRSAGVRDLAGGIPSGQAPPLPWVRHHTVTAELSMAPANPVTSWLGDLLVNEAGAELGAGDRVRIAPAHHFDLLNHRLVYQALLRWLGPAEAPGSAG